MNPSYSLVRVGCSAVRGGLDFFASGVKGVALNFENENIGIVVFDSGITIKKRRFCQAHWIYCGCSRRKDHFRLCGQRVGSTY